MQILEQESVKKLDPSVIRSRVASCPALPSLGRISKALQDLLFAETSGITNAPEFARYAAERN
jgi:hypothetical protein